MRSLILPALLFTLGADLAAAQVAPVPPAPASTLPKAREPVSAQNRTDADAIADCDRMWDRGTHMTKQEWSRTCRRVQNRLQQNQIK